MSDNGKSLDFFVNVGNEAGLTLAKKTDSDKFTELRFQFKPIDKDDMGDNIKSSNITPDKENIIPYIEDFVGFMMILAKSSGKGVTTTLYILQDCYFFTK